MVEKNRGKIKILFLGASIGEMWDLPNFPSRVNNNNFILDFKAEYTADKTHILEDSIIADPDKPDIVIIKECASYFKADTDEYDDKYINPMKDLIKKWVNRCREHTIIPILCTVVPITEKMPWFNSFKQLVKKYIFFAPVKKINRYTRMEGIQTFNDWIRDYASKENINVLDLEKELRVDSMNKFLNPALSKDGLHINKTAYKLLDKLLLRKLNEIYDLNNNNR